MFSHIFFQIVFIPPLRTSRFPSSLLSSSSLDLFKFPFHPYRLFLQALLFFHTTFSPQHYSPHIKTKLRNSETLLSKCRACINLLTSSPSSFSLPRAIEQTRPERDHPASQPQLYVCNGVWPHRSMLNKADK